MPEPKTGEHIRRSPKGGQLSFREPTQLTVRALPTLIARSNAIAGDIAPISNLRIGRQSAWCCNLKNRLAEVTCRGLLHYSLGMVAGDFLRPSRSLPEWRRS